MARHAANIGRSKRLQRLLDVLRDGKPHTTFELQFLTGGCAIGSTVSELRAHKYDIECRMRGVSENGAKIYAYRLIA